MLEMFAEQLDRETPFKFQLASRGLQPVVGQVYLAPGEQHLCLRSDALTLDLNRDPMENFVRPAADPLFRSAASVFGKYCVGVVLTGMGRDGTQGAGQIKSSGGVVLVQDPKTAVASSMPQTVIGSGLADFVLPLEPLVKSIEDQVMQLACELKQNLKGESFSP